MFLKKIGQENRTEKNLWSKNFTILVFGSFISIAGANIIDMVFALLVLDMSNSGVLYSLILAIGNATAVIVPILLGSRLEKKHKERVIYSSDFFSAILFFVLGLLFKFNFANVNTIIIVTILFEATKTIYQLAYKSIFPALVDKENYGRAYSIDSVLSNVSECATLLAIVLYNFFRVELVLFAAGIFFLVAALFELRIKPEEGVGTAANAEIIEGNSLKAYFENYKVVFKMLKGTVGFQEIFLCNLVDNFRTGAMWALMLPFLEDAYDGRHLFGFHIPHEYIYLVILTAYCVGQFWCGAFNYKLNMQGKKRLNYLLIFSFLEVICIAVFPFFNIFGSTVLMFSAGIASIMTLCVYDTGIFEKVPEEIRTRFNGVFESISAICMIIGNLTGGFIIDYFNHPEFGFVLTGLPEIIVLIFMILSSLQKMTLFFCSTKELKVYEK